MRKFIYKILVLALLTSFSAEVATPLFRNDSAASLLQDTQEADEKKDSDKKEKKMNQKTRAHQT